MKSQNTQTTHTHTHTVTCTHTWYLGPRQGISIHQYCFLYIVAVDRTIVSLSCQLEKPHIKAVITRYHDRYTENEINSGVSHLGSTDDYYTSPVPLSAGLTT